MMTEAWQWQKFSDGILVTKARFEQLMEVLAEWWSGRQKQSIWFIRKKKEWKIKNKEKKESFSSMCVSKIRNKGKKKSFSSMCVSFVGWVCLGLLFFFFLVCILFGLGSWVSANGRKKIVLVVHRISLYLLDSIRLDNDWHGLPCFDSHFYNLLLIQSSSLQVY